MRLAATGVLGDLNAAIATLRHGSRTDAATFDGDTESPARPTRTTPAMELARVSRITSSRLE